MFNKASITENLSLINFFKKINFDLYLTKTQLNHLKNISDSMITDCYTGKISDTAKLPQATHRSSISRFLSKSPWDEELLKRSYQRLVVDLIYKISCATNKKIYFIIDDTISEKTKPSSKAEKIIQDCGFHKSHLTGKTVYGHQILVSMLSCDGLVLPYSIEIYKKNFRSKIDMAKNLIELLSKSLNKVCVLCDSWYSCQSIFNCCEKCGFEYVGGLKSNRIIFPKDETSLGIKISDYGKKISKEKFNLVTVNENNYYVYSYQGKLKDRKNITAVITYPEALFEKREGIKAFICLDGMEDSLEILKMYSHRWAIEPFFRDCKAHLGLNGYKIRSSQSIKRYFLIMIINYSYCKIYCTKSKNFSDGYNSAKNNFKKTQVKYIYDTVKTGKSLKVLYEILKIA